MESNDNNQPTPVPPETEATPVPPKQSPKNAAGSVNPKEKNAFYEALVKKSDRRKKR